MLYQFGVAVLLLPILAIIYKGIASYIKCYYDDRKAFARGCELAHNRYYKYPAGIDLVTRMFEADKRNQVPNEFEKIFEEMPTATTMQQFFFGDRILNTVDPKNIQALLATQFNDFEIGPTRRGNFFPLLGNGIFTADGKGWEHSRALLRPQFARDQVGDLELEENHVQNLFKHLNIDAAGWTQEVDLQPLFFRLTMDSATEFLFGESTNSQNAALPTRSPEKRGAYDSLGFEPSEVAKAFDRGMHTLGIRGRFGNFYWLYNSSQFQNDIKLVHKFADYYVQRAITDATTRSTGSKVTDVSEKRPKYVFAKELALATQDPIELRSQLLNILLAGRDTTAGLLGWTFWLLARHPDILAKLRRNIIDAFGPYKDNTGGTSHITFASLKSCTYLQHTLNEVLRLFPSVPLNSRRSVKDTTIPYGGGPNRDKPVFVPKGTQVDYSVHVMHRRKDLWGPDAREFKPERWVGKKAGWEFLPFNGGPRICLGQQFALTEAGYVIVRLLQRFDTVIDPNIPSRSEKEMEAGVHGEAAYGWNREEEKHQYSVTTAPVSVTVRLRLAKS